MIRGIVVSTLAVLTLVACGSPVPSSAPTSGSGPAPVPIASARQSAMTQTEPPAPTPPRLGPAPSSPSSSKEIDELEKALPPIAYDPKGRRDPFEQLQVTTGAKGLTVAAARLTGIVRGEQTTLALVEAPDGIGYVMRTGDILGDGRLVEIGGDTAVFVVAARAGASPNRITLRLNTE